MYYTDKINAALIEEICTPVLEKLIAEEYRSGFNDSVLTCMKAAVSNVDVDQGKYLWSAACCGDMDIERPGPWTTMGFTEAFMKLYERAQEEESKEGCFVMPEWGTRGT